jgi:large subunit ribosomal protein L17
MMNLAKSLITYEQILTTLPKAKDLRPYVEKLLTLGKAKSLHARRQLIATLGCTDLADKVMTTLADRYEARPGGYTRIIKAGFRHGDASPIA